MEPARSASTDPATAPQPSDPAVPAVSSESPAPPDPPAPGTGTDTSGTGGAGGFALRCDGSRTGDATFDLLSATVTTTPRGARFTADYSGATALHDVLITFGIANTVLTVEGELFEDGTGVARVVNASGQDAVFVDAPTAVTSGRIDLSVPTSDLGGVAATALSSGVVTLTVDGTEVERCATG